MEGVKGLKSVGKVPGSLPSIGDDVEFGAEDGLNGNESDQFATVEEEIDLLKGKCKNATLAKSTADSMVKSVGEVELKESTRMTEEQFGRKLYRNVRMMFRFALGSAMLAIVEHNYPINRYIARQN
jgi:hypothetical protein